MRKLKALLLFLILSSLCLAQRNDTAHLVNVQKSLYDGSLQNASWSPTNQYLLCTNWESGYNQYPANVCVITLSDSSIRFLTTDGESNVNMPGLTWSPITNKVVFSSEHNGNGDQVHTMDASGLPGTAVKITPFTDRVCWEPGFSPDGEWIVYEAHYPSNPANGIIETYKIDGSLGPYSLSATNTDARQPSWSPAGNKIVYQQFNGSNWDIWTINPNGTNKQNITATDPGDKTDATFSPNGEWIVYSADSGTLEYANIFIKNLTSGQLIRVTNYSGYDGAPSWSADNRIAFESTAGDPDTSSGATLWIIGAPIDGIVGTENLTNNEQTIKIYPNPASNQITVITPSIEKESNLVIYNINGQELIKQRIKNNITKIDITHLMSGIYFVKLISNKNIDVRKIIKE